MNQRKLLFTLAQQDRAPIHRDHIKNRIQYFTYEILHVSQPINAAGNLQQHTEVPCQSFVLTKIDCRLLRIEQGLRAQALGGLRQHLGVIELHQRLVYNLCLRMLGLHKA